MGAKSRSDLQRAGFRAVRGVLGVLTTILDLSGAALVAAFAFFVWPPLTLLVAGVVLLLASWRLSSAPVLRRASKRPFRSRFRREGAS